LLRRFDAVLELTKADVLETKASLDSAGISNQDFALRQAAGQASTTRRPSAFATCARGSQQKLRADFEAYLDGFSPNVQEILDNFEFRNQLPRLSKADALGTLIEKIVDPAINLSPDPVHAGDGSVRHPGLDNQSMGTIFEELVRRSRRRTTRRPESTGPREMRFASWRASSSCRSPGESNRVLTCSTTERAARAAC
jgi:type I restriction enzyme M protein